MESLIYGIFKIFNTCFLIFYSLINKILSHLFKSIRAPAIVSAITELLSKLRLYYPRPVIQEDVSI